MSVNKQPNLPDNFHDFSRSLQTDAGIALGIGHSNFFSIPFHSIICQFLHHCQYRLEDGIKIYEQLMCSHHKHKIQSSQWTLTTMVCFSNSHMTHHYKVVFMSIISVAQYHWQTSDEYGALVNSYSQGKTECSEKNLSQSIFFHHKSHKDWPGTEPQPQQGEGCD